MEAPMKRLLAVLVAVTAVLAMAIGTGVVRAEGGDDGSGDHATTPTQTQTQPCDQSGENEAGDSSVARMSDDNEGTSGTDDDHLNGGKGHDVRDGNSGNDTINARDGQRDVVNCGSGRDRVRADKRD